MFLVITTIIKFNTWKTQVILIINIVIIIMIMVVLYILLLCFYPYNLYCIVCKLMLIVCDILISLILFFFSSIVNCLLVHCNQHFERKKVFRRIKSENISLRGLSFMCSR